MRALIITHSGMAALNAQAMTGGTDRDLTVTATGSTSQSGSYLLRASITEVTVCSAGNGVRLPADAIPGDEFLIFNNTTAVCLLYPPTSSTLNTQASNASLTIAAGGVVRVKAVKPTEFAVVGFSNAMAAPVAAGATLAMSAATHAGKTILLDTAAGSVVTLPAATGSMSIYRFVVSVIATTNSHIIKVANASDAMQGIIQTMSDDPATMKGFAAVAGTSDTITLNRTTTGSVTIGEYIEVQDIAVNKFQVSGVTSSTGTEATPFSATV